jgi:hypothetical protein
MRVQKTYDLDIDFCKKDIQQLKDGKTLSLTIDSGLEIRASIGKTDRNKSFDVRKIATVQNPLPFNDYELFEFRLEPKEWIHGYRVILREDLFLKWVKETEEKPNSENVTNPFWGRGIQFSLPLDRIHICYYPTLL